MERLGRLLVRLGWVAALLIAGFVALVLLMPTRAPPRRANPVSPAAAPAVVESRDLRRSPATASSRPGDCSGPGFESAARANAVSLTSLAWQPFHRDETGWEIYAPRIAQEIGVSCDASSPGFAMALARWQRAHSLAANGQLNETTFTAMSTGWEMARPFVRDSHAGACPTSPPQSQLVWAQPGEGYARKAIQLRPEALAAYRRLVAGARDASPAIAANPELLTIFSGYRSPGADALHCSMAGGCGNITRALCSAHRTGLAVDLYLGAAPGHAPESSDDVNRLYQSRSAAYAWLVANAGTYGFVNYPFEPWHWEWTGATP
jgi:zinc D-Ala-D-Ala carboxypeptidase